MEPRTVYGLADRAAGLLARGMALLGGAVLIAVVVTTCLSIIGRALVPLGLAPVPGDFELVEMGVGFAIFAFLPYAQYARAHARVDLLAARFGARMNRVIDLVADIGMGVAAALIAWRLWLGMLDKRSYAETTFILQFPIWIAYAAALAGAIAFFAVALFCAWRAARALWRGEDGAGMEPGAAA